MESLIPREGPWWKVRFPGRGHGEKSDPQGGAQRKVRWGAQAFWLLRRF
jgi:hypothetical protein